MFKSRTQTFLFEKQSLSCGETKRDHIRLSLHNELRYVAMKCDKVQQKLKLWHWFCFIIGLTFVSLCHEVLE